MGTLDGKTALVVGGGSGIGQAIAIALAARGAKVAVAGRRADRLDAVVAGIESVDGFAVAHAADCTDEAAVDALFAAVVRDLGRLDILVNSAGAFDGGPIDELPLEAWNRVIATNLTAPFLCTRAAMRVMKPQRGGRIINIGSISAKRVRPNTAPYCASKFGLAGLTECTALEGRMFGITCGAIHPGNVLVERRTDTGAPEDDEPMIDVSAVASLAATMAALPPEANLLEAVVLPRDQDFVGRG